jgi:parallel beta-helix repeat protein
MRAHLSPGRRTSVKKPGFVALRTFYVDPAGSDSNAGTSTGAAWATAAKVNSTTFLSGDAILFKAGSVWRETLIVPRSGIKIGAYGSGSSPVLRGANLRTGWTSEAGLYYSSQADWPRNQVFRNGSRLLPAATKAGLATGQHWYDDTNRRLYVFDDPTGQTMEVSTRASSVLVSGVSDVIIDGIEASGALRTGIDVFGGSARIMVSNCGLHYNGQHGYAALTRSGDSSMPDLSVIGGQATYNGDCGVVAGSDVPRWRVAGCVAHHNGCNPNGGGVTGNILYTSRGLVGRRVNAYTAPPVGAVAIAAGASIQAAIDANPAGTAFKLAAGTYSGQNIWPNAGNKFYGAPDWTTIIDGGGSVASFTNGQGIGSVVMSGLSIRNYAPPNNGIGCLGTDGSAADWIVENCEITGMALGQALMLGTRMTVRDCYFHHNARSGINCSTVTSPLVYNNEMAWNNQILSAPFTASADTAGIKICTATTATIRNNYSHHNIQSPGIWTDISCSGSIIEGNVTTDNGLSGIIIEIDYGATVRNNFIARNNQGLISGFGGGGIYVQNSQNGFYYNNDMRENGGGIWLWEDNRGAGPSGTWLTQNNAFHDNLVVASSGDHGYGGTSGGTAKSNVFTRNAYQLTASARWVVAGSTAAFSAWQTAGQDGFTSGSGAVNLSVAPVHTAVTGISPTAAATVVVEDCTSYRAGYSAADVAQVDGGGRGQGIWLDRPGTNSAIRRCVSYQCAGAGVRIDNAGASSGAVVEQNITYSNGQGVVLYRSTGGATVRHNTAYGNAYNMWLSGEFGGETVSNASNTVRDNIGYAGTVTNFAVMFGADNTGTLSTGNTYQKNGWGVAAAGFVRWGWGGSQATYAALDTASGQTQSNIPGDPLFTNAAAADFTLQAGSPMLNAATDGTNLGAK